MNLDELRSKIDNIDSEMCRLFAERMQVVTDIALYKKANNMVVYHPSRARAVLQNISKQLGPEFEGYGRSLYRTIFDLSESYQTKMLSQEEDFYQPIKELTSKPPMPFPGEGHRGLGGKLLYRLVKVFFLREHLCLVRLAEVEDCAVE